MTTQVQFFQLTSSDPTDFDALFAIYKTSLPVSEQKPVHQLRAMLERDDYLFLILCVAQQIQGFAIAYVSKQSPFYLLEYMAIDPSQRNLGYGAQLYQALREQVNSVFGGARAAMIEVDSPDELSSDQTLRRRRVDFYRRCGAVVVKGLDYLLPLDTGEPPPAMWLMLHMPCTELPGPTMLCEWLADIFDKVYRQPADDRRLLMMRQQLMEF